MAGPLSNHFVIVGLQWYVLYSAVTCNSQEAMFCKDASRLRSDSSVLRVIAPALT